MSSKKTNTDPHPEEHDKLRVLFVTEDDPLYVIEFFKVFFVEYPRDRLDVIGITIVDAFHEPIWKTANRMLNFYGFIDFIRLSFRFVLAKLRGRSIGKVAVDHSIDLIDAKSVNATSYINMATDLSPDVVVSVAAPEVFKKPFLDVPKVKCINIHSGRLPVYRGMMPNFWQLLHGEPHATITIHEMAEQLDAGGVIATHDFPLRTHDSLDRVIVGTKQEGARLMMKVLVDYANDAVQVTPLDMQNASYFSFPTSKDVKALRERGHTML